jgi:Ca2+-binding RTX toxin-like protein
MNTYAITKSSTTWRRHLLAATLALAAALTVPADSGASPAKAHGVQAKVKHGTLEVKGNSRANTLALRLQVGDPTRLEVDVGDNGSADLSFARDAISALDVKVGEGDDSVRIDDLNGAFTNTIPTEIAGGAGDDLLHGGLGAEAFTGGAGNDVVIGGKGNDDASLGRGKDAFQWDPGDGSDSIVGDDGGDTMEFNDAAVNENVTLSASGRRFVLFRDVGGVTMDTDDVETVEVNNLGGTDNVTVNDLTGTDVTRANIDLAGVLGGGGSDGAIDNVVVNATNGDDAINIDGNGNAGADVTGLATAVSITHADPTDKLSVNTLAGTDNVLTNGVAGVIQVLVDGVAV